MNQQEAAAWEIHSFLTGIEIPYAIIGGLAVQFCDALSPRSLDSARPRGNLH